MTLNKHEAISELEWLMGNYRELLSWNPRVERLMIACKMGAESLKDDPEERHNLADEYPEMVKRFDEEMRRMHQPSECWPLDGE